MTAHYIEYKTYPLVKKLQINSKSIDYNMYSACSYVKKVTHTLKDKLKDIIYIANVLTLVDLSEHRKSYYTNIQSTINFSIFKQFYNSDSANT